MGGEWQQNCFDFDFLKEEGEVFIFLVTHEMATSENIRGA
jgi:hypothetical protein